MKTWLLAACALAFALGAGTASAQKIIINQSGQSTSAASVYLASDMDFFKQQGLDVSFVTTGSGIKSIAPLATGATQFCACIVTHPMQANQSGAADTRLIAGITSGYPTRIILRTDLATRLGLKPDTSLADRVHMLNGLKIGVTELGASTDQALRMTMEAYGMNPARDAVIIALGGLPQMIPAMANEQVDAVSGSPPAPERLMKEGIGVQLVDPMREHVGQLDVALFMGLAVETGYLTQHRDIATRVVQALANAQTFLHEHKEAARKVIRETEFPTMPQEAFDAAFDAQFPSYQPTPAISRESLDGAVKAAAILIPGYHATYEELVDPSIAQEVMRK